MSAPVYDGAMPGRAEHAESVLRSAEARLVLAVRHPYGGQPDFMVERALANVREALGILRVAPGATP